MTDENEITITLTPDTAAYAAGQVGSGDFESTSELVVYALRLLSARQRTFDELVRRVRASGAHFEGGYAFQEQFFFSEWEAEIEQHERRQGSEPR
ncbi:hypothetical protein Pla163_33580 [Planctomycetes bacterium Pla163]|uniref:Uncharacterized protein n=1 Tax=Rohdeia mirabilis TaxID=2528008 RepID=A0A518D414_9BACT|nr:hypothetical protein Pla163_33580 [Planctomycetes bacterium Pla163]